MGDGMCDELNNNAECNYDGEDCAGGSDGGGGGGDGGGGGGGRILTIYIYILVFYSRVKACK